MIVKEQVHTLFQDLLIKMFILIIAFCVGNEGTNNCAFTNGVL